MYDYLRKAVKNFPTKSAIIYKNVEITYKEIGEWVFYKHKKM